MIDDQSLRFLFKLVIVVYVALVATSLVVPRPKPSEELLKETRNWPRWYGNLVALIGVGMIGGGAVGLAGLFFGWEPARWIFGGSVFCKITGTLILPVTDPSSRWDAFRREAEAFLDGALVVASFIAVEALF